MDRRRLPYQFWAPVEIVWGASDAAPVPSNTDRTDDRIDIEHNGAAPQCGPSRGMLNPRAPVYRPEVDQAAVNEAMRACRA